METCVELLGQSTTKLAKLSGLVSWQFWGVDNFKAETRFLRTGSSSNGPSGLRGLRRPRLPGALRSLLLEASIARLALSLASRPSSRTPYGYIVSSTTQCASAKGLVACVLLVLLVSQVDGSRLLTKHRPNAAWPRAGTLVLPSVGPEVASKPHAGMGGSDGMALSVMSNTIADSDTLRSCSRFWMCGAHPPSPKPRLPLQGPIMNASFHAELL